MHTVNLQLYSSYWGKKPDPGTFDCKATIQNSMCTKTDFTSPRVFTKTVTYTHTEFHYNRNYDLNSRFSSEITQSWQCLPDLADLLVLILTFQFFSHIKVAFSTKLMINYI